MFLQNQYCFGTFQVVYQLNLCVSIAGTWVWSLVRDLRTCMLCGVVRKGGGHYFICMCICVCIIYIVSYISVQFSCSVVSDSFWPRVLHHARLPCPSPTPGTCSYSCPSSQWCHPTISSSVVPFSSCLQSFPASGSFSMNQFFAWGGQSIGVSASASVLPMNIHDWFPLGWTGWISLKSKGFSRVFSNTTVQKHQFFGAQLSSQSNSHTHTWPLEKP